MEMENISEMLMVQKPIIDKIKPSLVARQLEDIKEHIDIVIEDNEKLFEQTYLKKLVNRHNQVEKP